MSSCGSGIDIDYDGAIEWNSLHDNFEDKAAFSSGFRSLLERTKMWNWLKSTDHELIIKLGVLIAELTNTGRPKKPTLDEMVEVAQMLQEHMAFYRHIYDPK